MFSKRQLTQRIVFFSVHITFLNIMSFKEAISVTFIHLNLNVSNTTVNFQRSDI